MYRATTSDISVQVETFYQETASNPEDNNFVFAYRVVIENNSDETVRLISRHWHIVDSNGCHNEVMGDGVVGLQPLLHSEKRHEYVSGCHLHSDMGKMYGTYLMERASDGSRFHVRIPEFTMIVPTRLN